MKTFREWLSHLREEYVWFAVVGVTKAAQALQQAGVKAVVPNPGAEEVLAVNSLDQQKALAVLKSFNFQPIGGSDQMMKAYGNNPKYQPYLQGGNGAI